MSGIQMSREDFAERVILHLQGTFDGAAARLVRGVVAGIDAEREIVLDFSRVTDFQDVSVGVLTGILSQREVRLTGLRTHQERMFQYFGVGTGTREREGNTPEGLRVA
jgi:anti-anti-sigma regulatory factor